MIPRLWTCDKYVSALEGSLLWKYYEGPHNWAGIILGTSTAEETLEILQSMDDFEMETIYISADYYEAGTYYMVIDEKASHRADVITLQFVDNIVESISFRYGKFYLGDILRHFSNLEKVAVDGWYFEWPNGILIIGLSEQDGIITWGGQPLYISFGEIEQKRVDPSMDCSVTLIGPITENLKEATLVSPDIWDYLLEDGFEDWVGFDTYDVKWGIPYPN